MILPYLNEESVYAQYRFDEPWNGPNNRLLAEEIRVEQFQCPSGPERGRPYNTNYVAVVGEATIFPGSGTAKLSDISDGQENTILITEIGNSNIHWMEPRDLVFESLRFLPHPRESSPTAISSHHPAGPGVAFVNHGYDRLRKSLSDSTLQSLFTIAGGESIGREDLERSSGSHLAE